MLLAQSLIEYGALESLAEGIMRFRARGYAWFDEWGDMAMVIGGVLVVGWAALRVFTRRRRY